MKRIALGLAVVLFWTSAGVTATFDIDPAHSSVGFSIRHFMSDVVINIAGVAKK